jgi:proton-translocating NADH-quinone oxidoreductase chain N
MKSTEPMTISFLELFGNDLKAIFPEIYLSIAILILIVYGVVYSTSIHYNNPILINSTSWLSIYIIVLTILLVYNDPIHTGVILRNLLVSDSLTSFIKTILLFSSMSCILISFDYLKRQKLNSFEYTILMLLATLGMLLMISSYDLLSMYLAIELQSLCLYVMATFQRHSIFSTEAGLKYFLLGAFSSGVLLFGSSMVYGFTGTTNFGELAILFSGISDTSILTSSGILIGIIFIAVALLFKLAAAPFHMWAPDVYEGSPTSVTAFFAIVPKIAIIGLFLRLFFYGFHDFIGEWQQILLFCSIGSMIIGAFGALSQKKIKRLFAYSAIGHVGYMLIGLVTGTVIGIQGILLYITIYIFTMINLFGIILTSDKEYISSFRGMSQTDPLLAATFSITLFSMAAIPPLAGFYSKFYLFVAAMESNLYLLAIVGILTSVISSVYYIRIIKMMYFQPKIKLKHKEIDQNKSLLVTLTSFFILFFFLNPRPLLLITYKVALTLCF